MRKKIIMLVIILILITGCTKENKKDDISNYIEKELGLKNYSVSKDYETIKGSDT